jgi:glucuronate isomerase
MNVNLTSHFPYVTLPCCCCSTSRRLLNLREAWLKGEHPMPGRSPVYMPEDRYFDPDPRQKAIAQQLYTTVKELPLVCPHGHIDPRMFADPDYSFGSPAEMLVIPDHYVFRLLYSQGIPMERLGIARRDGGEVERDHRKIWQLFGENFHLFRGTPTGMWLTHVLHSVFGVRDKLTGETAQDIYDQIVAQLQLPEFRPRRMYERFRIEVLCTTDAATDALSHHRAIRESGWHGRILPTCRLDGLANMYAPDWCRHMEALSEVSGREVTSYRALIQALEERRAFFKQMGARATDHSPVMVHTQELTEHEADSILLRALRGRATTDEAMQFTGHMLMESARMSIEDGLVMQIHPGSYRNHNQWIYDTFGSDGGGDIPVEMEFTRSLHALLNKYGNDTRLTLIIFTLDEATYARELAPLAGHYPALKLGPPWWFQDSVNGMIRYRQLTMDAAGLYNTVGFNDDTRSFPSIPSRHDLWRRMEANWLAGLVVRGIVDVEDAAEMIHDTSYRLAKKAYKF